MTRSVFWSVLCLSLCARGQAADDRPDIVVADFEQETYGDWKATGEAFGPGPAAGTLPGQMNVDGFEGKRLVNSFAGGDGTVGTLTSPPFVLERKYLNFLIGGGAHYDTRIDLLVDGKVVQSASGPNDRPGGSERLEWRTWDLSTLTGQKGMLRIVDEHRGGWGHISIDQVVQSDRKRMAEPARWEIAVDKRYLWLPVQTGAPRQRMRFSVDGQVVREFEIELAQDRTDFHAMADVSAFRGKPLVIESQRRGDSPLPAIEQHDELPAANALYRESLRPQFHFTSRRGWLNDPNGLVWKDGEYHLYYQHNPYGHGWGNMHWGHAVSPDLLRWKELPIGLYPQKFGDWAFSGSAVVDERNESGFGTRDKPPLVGAYTSTGRGECIVYSNDNGRTWTEYEGNPVVRHVGRDPRLLYHKGAKLWVMALYSEQDGKRWITFHTSPDLKSWTFASRIEGFFECPDLVELPVAGGSGQTRWVLYGADGQYLVGAFDGKVFTPEGNDTRKQRVWHGNFYAAQSYSNAPDGRCIQIGWANGIVFPGMPFNQQMTIPVELSLRKTGEGLRLFAVPVRELKSLEDAPQQRTDLRIDPETPQTIDAGGTEMRVRATVVGLPSQGELAIDVGGEKVLCSGRTAKLTVRDVTVDLPVRDSTFSLDILLDRRSIEVFVNDGEVAISRERASLPEGKTVGLSSGGGTTRVRSLDVSRVRSVWPAAESR